MTSGPPPCSDVVLIVETESSRAPRRSRATGLGRHHSLDVMVAARPGAAPRWQHVPTAMTSNSAPRVGVGLDRTKRGSETRLACTGSGSSQWRLYTPAEDIRGMLPATFPKSTLAARQLRITLEGMLATQNKGCARCGT